jgi:hypothetical protein
VAFVHAAYCYWDAGERTAVLDEHTVRTLVANRELRTATPSGGSPPFAVRRSPFASYIQIPPRVLWSRVEGSEFHEPIDGWFAIPDGNALRVVACLGVHAERPGLSVLTARGTTPPELRREDGSAPFAPLMEGGAEAGLHSVADGDELLWLARKASEQREASNEE